MSGHYISLSDDLKAHFKEKIYKIPLDSGTTCPNRDGSKGIDGCYYCSDAGAYYLDQQKASIADQITATQLFYQKKKKPPKFLAYFQSYTSTYASLEILKDQYQTAVSDPDIIGLAVSTRPDCLSDDVLALLAEFMLPRYHWLELGLQSIHNTTLTAINRGHSYEDFLTVYHKAKRMGFRISVHIILGLPGETEAMQLETIRALADLDIDGIKLHHLHILKGSVFEQRYQEGKITLYTQDAYIALLGKIIPLLPKKTVIHRLIGDAPKDLLIAPLWSYQKIKTLQAIEQYLALYGIYQGSAFNIKPSIAEYYF